MIQANVIETSPVQQEMFSPTFTVMKDTANLAALKEALLKIKTHNLVGAEESLQAYLISTSDNFEKASAHIQVAEHYNDCAKELHDYALSVYQRFYSEWLDGHTLHAS